MNMHTLHLAMRIPANVKPPKAEDWYTELVNDIYCYVSAVGSVCYRHLKYEN